MASPILAVDVHYGADIAVAGGILFDDWTSETVQAQYTARRDGVEPYRAGAFFERELPILLDLIDAVPTRPGTIIVDGYVTLGADRRDGLGACLYQALGGSTPVIGIAKTRFRDTPSETEVLRGRSRTPLYVTSRGTDENKACQLTRQMHGPHRMPTLLKAVDRLCREALALEEACQTGR